MENPVKIDDFGVTLFLETPIYNSTFNDLFAKSSGPWSNFIHGTGEYL